MKCEICGKDILNDSQCIDYKYYHNDCIINLTKENQKYKEVIDKAIELLGNYKHYSTPDEKQNGDNEDLVNNAFDILKEVE